MQRTHRIRVRLNEREKALLDQKVKQSGLSREAYMRQLLNKIDIPDKPQPDYCSMKNELHQTGMKFNFVARKFHETNMIDVEQFNEARREFQESVNRIIEAVK